MENFGVYFGRDGSWIQVSFHQSSKNYMLTRYKPDGGIDVGFADHGILMLPIGNPDLGLAGQEILFQDVIYDPQRDELLIALIVNETSSDNLDDIEPTTDRPDEWVLGSSLVVLKYDADGKALDQDFGKKGLFSQTLLQEPKVSLIRHPDDKIFISVDFDGSGESSLPSHVIGLDLKGKFLKFGQNGVLQLPLAVIGKGNLNRHPKVLQNGLILLTSSEIFGLIDKSMNYIIRTIEISPTGAVAVKIVGKFIAVPLFKDVMVDPIDKKVFVISHEREGGTLSKHDYNFSSSDAFQPFTYTCDNRLGHTLCHFDSDGDRLLLVIHISRDEKAQILTLRPDGTPIKQLEMSLDIRGCRRLLSQKTFN